MQNDTPPWNCGQTRRVREGETFADLPDFLRECQEIVRFSLYWMSLDTKALRKNVMHDMPMDVGQPEISSLESIGQPFVIDTQQV
ncbi:hypothetical protein GCM10023155_44170 [Bremerella cremea]